MTLTSKDYRSYIQSQEWREKHKDFLKRSHYRCSFLPFVPIGKKLKGKYRRYAIHHLNYHNLGEEVLWEDVICVHPWIHKWILHGILSGFKRPSQQKSYPNTAQRLAHYWCCLPVIIKTLLIIAILANIIKLL